MHRCGFLLLCAACGGKPLPPAAPVPAPAPTPAPAPAYTGLGAESVPAEVVAKYAPPTLDEAVKSRVQAFFDLRSASAGFATSRGDRIVFTWTITGVAQTWRQDGPMRWPVQLTGGEDSTQARDLTPDDRFIVVERDRAGEETPGLYLLSIEGGPLVEIQHLPKVQTRLAFVSDDSRFVYFFSNDVDPRSYALHRWNRETRKRETLFTESGIWGYVDHLGDRLLLDKTISSSHDEMWELDLTTRKLSPVLGQTEEGTVTARYGARPGTLLVLTDRLSDVKRLYEARGGELTPISPESPYEVSSFSIDDARTKIFYSVNHDGLAELHALDARTLKPLALPELPEAENVSAGRTTRDGRFTNFSVDGSRLPPTSVTYDWTTRKSISWRAPATPEIDVTRFVRGTLEHFPARDGTPIPMFVYRPPSCGDCPVVVDFHGGPESQSMGGWNREAQLFVDAGFVFVQPNVRGSSGRGKKWLDADNGPRRLEVIGDIEDCARYIRQAWAKDGRAPRIGIKGGSYGGYAALMGMTYFAGAYDAGVSLVGIANLMTFLGNTAPYRRAIRMSEYGDLEKDHDALVKLSPITYIDRVKGPLLIMQGVNDPRVPVGEALLMHDALNARGIESRLILFAEEGHGAVSRVNQVLQIGHALAFFQKHLK